MDGHIKGNLLETGVNFAFALVFIGILLGAGAIALGSFSSGYVSTLNANSSLWTGTQQDVVNVLGNSSGGILNLSLQLPTVGTIAGVGLIILVLFVAIGAYVFGKKQ